MRFISRWDNAVYVVRPKTTVAHPITGQPMVKDYGLQARFGGKMHIFDSAVAQKEASPKWTDEEREAVEEYLLQHKDFGFGLYLAPGEAVPEGVTLPAAPTQRCTHFVSTADGPEQCVNDSLPQKEFCGVHDPENSRIVPGILTTNQSEVI